MAIHLGCITFENLCPAGVWPGTGNLNFNMNVTAAAGGGAYGPTPYVVIPFPGGTMNGDPAHDHPLIATAINNAQVVVAGAPVTAFVDQLNDLYILFNYDDAVLKPLSDANQSVTVSNNTGFTLRVTKPTAAQDALGSTAGNQLVTKQTMYRAVAVTVGAALALRNVA